MKLIFGQKVVWKDITEGKLIDVIAEEFPDREALVIDGIRKTYAEYLTDINKITYGLIELGVSKGDTVGIMARNIYEWMVSWYALAKIGVYIVPMDYWYKDTEAHFIMHHAEMKAVLCSSEYVPMIFLLMIWIISRILCYLIKKHRWKIREFHIFGP